jgi:hypothetical protein
MEKTDGRLVGIFGTVIIHLIVGIIIMAFKISELHVKANLILDLELLTEFENRNNNSNNEELRLHEASGTTIERALQGDAELINIARNLARTPDATISREDYIDMVKDELIRSGQLGADNYIDQQRGNGRSSNNENFVPVSSSTTTVPVRNETRETSDREVATVNYRGPTRIEYDLGGREHTYIHTPIYKCQGAGIITLRIEVNQRGNVEKATVLTRESSTDLCLVETAISSALASRFSSDINAPKIQTGTLMFQFVAQ